MVAFSYFCISLFSSLFQQVMVVSEMSKDLEIPNCPSCVFTEWMWAEQGQDFGSTEDVRSLGPAPGLTSLFWKQGDLGEQNRDCQGSGFR